MDITQCASCDADIWFGLTRTGKTMPINAEPVADGNVILDETAEVAAVLGTPRVRVTSRKNPAPEGADRYTSHFFTCPNASFHRRRS